MSKVESERFGDMQDSIHFNLSNDLFLIAAGPCYFYEIDVIGIPQSDFLLQA